MIRENYPDSDLILFNYYTTSHPIQLELFPNKEFFSEIHLLPGNLSKIQFYLSFFKICLKHRYKKIFVLAGGVPKVLAFAAIFLQFRKLTSSLYLENSRGPIWKVYVEGLKKHGLSASDDIFDFPLTDAELNLGRETAKQIQKDQKLPLIAFGIGGKKPACLWKIENYIQVINSMKQKMSFIPVYVGGPSDRKNAVELIKSCGGIFLQDTNSKTLRESMAFF